MFVLCPKSPKRSYLPGSTEIQLRAWGQTRRSERRMLPATRELHLQPRTQAWADPGMGRAPAVTSVLTLLPWKLTTGEALRWWRPRGRVTCTVQDAFVSNQDQRVSGHLSRGFPPKVELRKRGRHTRGTWRLGLPQAFCTWL